MLKKLMSQCIQIIGTPEGVGPVKIGQKITAGITGLSEVQFDVDRRVKPLS